MPVRYGADHRRVVLDIPKPEAITAARKQATTDRAERRQKDAIAAADTEVTRLRKHPHDSRGG